MTHCYIDNTSHHDDKLKSTVAGTTTKIDTMSARPNLATDAKARILHIRKREVPLLPVRMPLRSGTIPDPRTW